MKSLEKSYSYVFKKVLKTINPLKKKIIKTECIIHKFLNMQALSILKNDGYIEAYKLMDLYINHINDGVVWADQDLKSSNHFYNPHKKKGLYGSSNAKKECIEYYDKAIKEYFNGNVNESMFFLGATCHLIQDLTVPQHANIHLLKNHKSYENWVIKNHRKHNEFTINKNGVYFNSLEEYINFNAKEAIEVYRKTFYIKDKEARFHRITSKILTMAQATTAGVMLKFYEDINELKS